MTKKQCDGFGLKIGAFHSERMNVRGHNRVLTSFFQRLTMREKNKK
jgi:hypothetical protein